VIRLSRSATSYASVLLTPFSYAIPAGRLAASRWQFVLPNVRNAPTPIDRSLIARLDRRRDAFRDPPGLRLCAAISDRCELLITS
jgi:hypothetical protein